MNYNPYAPPQAAPSPQGGLMAVGGGPQGWEIGEVLSAAFEAFKNNAVTFIVSVLIYGIVLLPFVTFPTVLKVTELLRPGPLSSLLTLASAVGNLSVQAFLGAGFVRIALVAARGQRPQIGDLFSGAGYFVPMLVVVFLNGAITLVGCLIFGSIFVYAGLCFAQYFVVDQGYGGLAALQTAWRACDGQHGQVLLYALVAFFLNMAGVACCGVGLFVTLPISAIGFAIIYLRLTGRGAAPAPGGQGGPGGGYGGGRPPGY
jgi:uncharacterized membrane protein